MRAILLPLLWAISFQAVSMSDTPNIPLVPDDVLTGCATSLTPQLEKETCWASGEYVPPASAVNQDALLAHYGGVMPHDGKQPITIVADRSSGQKRLKSISPGHAVWPTACEAPDLSNGADFVDSVVAFVCPGHYPYQGIWGNGQVPDYGINFYDGNYERRYRLALMKAIDTYPDDLDLQAGILRTGTSMGAVRSLAAMMNMEQELPQEQQLLSQLATHFHLRVGITQPHQVPVQRPDVNTQLNGYNLDLVDFDKVAATGKLDNKYLRIECDTGDPYPFCSPEIFQQADEHGIAMFGTWHDCGFHAVECAGFNFPYAQLYNTGSSQHRLDEPYVAFVNADSNHSGPAGHYNLGLAYSVDHWLAVDTALIASIFVTYTRHTNIGPGIPDQPTVSNPGLVVRNFQDFPLEVGDWINWEVRDGLGVDSSGTVQITEKGEIRLPPIALPDGETKGVVFTRGTTPLPQPTPIVYTRIPAQNTPMAGTPLLTQGAFQKVTDVALVNEGFQAGASVVIDLLNGTEPIVVHDCSNLADKCTAQEGRVSPDGTRIVYSVARATTLRQEQAWGFPYMLDNYVLAPVTTAEIWEYNVYLGTKRQVTSGHIDRQPVYLNNNTIVMSSDRANLHTLKGQYGYHESAEQCVWPCSQRQSHFNTPVMQIWQLNLDTGEAWNMTESEIMAISPEVMSNGDIVWSSGQFYDQNVIGKTPRNEYWVCRMKSNATDPSCVLNVHNSPTLIADAHLPDKHNNTGGLDQFRALRCMAEIEKDVLAATNYYRGNHSGCLGIIYSRDYSNAAIEGARKMANVPAALQWANANVPGSGLFTPSSLKILTPGGQAQDAEVKYKKDTNGDEGMPYGKFGYPSPWPEEDTYLMTWGKGECYLGAPPLYPRALSLGCHKVPALVKVPMVTDPYDPAQVEVLNDDPDWQMWDARPIVPYFELYGQNIPTQHPPVTEETCTLQVVDARRAEVFPTGTGKKMDNCQVMGCAVQPGLNFPEPEDHECQTEQCIEDLATGYHKENAHALAIYQLEHWNTPTTTYEHNNIGWRSIAKIAETPLEADGSVYQEVPCDTPVLTVVVDDDGMAITRNDMPHSSDGAQTCDGCHDAHSEERSAQLTGTVVERFANTIAAGKAPAPFHAPIRYTYEDVRPTIEKCAGCHANMLDPKVKNQVTGEEYFYSWFAWGNYTRPDQSEYVSKFALESPGYIHCPDTPTHATGASAAECNILGQWIDQGTQR